MLMAHAASELAAKTPGKEAVAIESFAKALRQVKFLDKFMGYRMSMFTSVSLWSVGTT